jgi:hypothetical protein
VLKDIGNFLVREVIAERQRHEARAEKPQQNRRPPGMIPDSHTNHRARRSVGPQRAQILTLLLDLSESAEDLARRGEDRGPGFRSAERVFPGCQEGIGGREIRGGIAQSIKKFFLVAGRGKTVSV